MEKEYRHQSMDPSIELKEGNSLEIEACESIVLCHRNARWEKNLHSTFLDHFIESLLPNNETERNETRRRLNFHIVHSIKVKNARNLHSPLGITQWKRKVSPLLLLVLVIKQCMMLEWTIPFQIISVSVSLISINTKLHQFSDRRNFFLILSWESELTIDWSA